VNDFARLSGFNDEPECHDIVVISCSKSTEVIHLVKIQGMQIGADFLSLGRQPGVAPVFQNMGQAQNTAKLWTAS